MFHAFLTKIYYMILFVNSLKTKHAGWTKCSLFLHVFNVVFAVLTINMIHDSQVRHLLQRDRATLFRPPRQDQARLLHPHVAYHLFRPVSSKREFLLRTECQGQTSVTREHLCEF